MIRELNVEEFDLLIPLGEEWFKEDNPLKGFNPEKSINSFINLVSSGVGYIIGYFNGEGVLKGGLVFIITPDFFTNDILAQELCWFVSKGSRGAGIKLLKEYERLAKEKGANQIALCHMVGYQDEQLDRVYNKFGYTLVDKIFRKGV